MLNYALHCLPACPGVLAENTLTLRRLTSTPSQDVHRKAMTALMTEVRALLDVSMSQYVQAIPAVAVLREVLISCMGHFAAPVRRMAIRLLNALVDGHDWQLYEPFFQPCILPCGSSPVVRTWTRYSTAELVKPAAGSPCFAFMLCGPAWDADVRADALMTVHAPTSVRALYADGQLVGHCVELELPALPRAGFYDWRLVTLATTAEDTLAVQPMPTIFGDLRSGAVPASVLDLPWDDEHALRASLMGCSQHAHITQGRIIVQPSNAAPRIMQEVVVDECGAQLEDGQVTRHGTFAEVARRLPNWQQEGAQAVLACGAIARDSGWGETDAALALFTGSGSVTPIAGSGSYPVHTGQDPLAAVQPDREDAVRAAGALQHVVMQDAPHSLPEGVTPLALRTPQEPAGLDWSGSNTPSVTPMPDLECDPGMREFAARPDASMYANTDRSCFNRMAGGQSGWDALASRAARLSMGLFVKVEPWVSSSRFHRKYGPLLVHCLDDHGREVVMPGSDGSANQWDDTASLNYRRAASWDLLLSEVMELADCGATGVYLSEAQSYPFIFETDLSELGRRDPDGHAHYTPADVMRGTIVVPHKELGYWRDAAYSAAAAASTLGMVPSTSGYAEATMAWQVDSEWDGALAAPPEALAGSMDDPVSKAARVGATAFMNNPLLAWLVRAVWTKHPHFVVLGESHWGRDGALMRCGVVPRDAGVTAALASAAGVAASKAGVHTSKRDDPSPAAALRAVLKYQACTLPPGGQRYLLRCSTGSRLPYPAVLLGRATWPAVDVVATLEGVPLLFGEESRGQPVRIDVAGAYAANEQFKQEEAARRAQERERVRALTATSRHRSAGRGHSPSAASMSLASEAQLMLPFDALTRSRARAGLHGTGAGTSVNSSSMGASTSMPVQSHGGSPTEPEESAPLKDTGFSGAAQALLAAEYVGHVGAGGVVSPNIIGQPNTSARPPVPPPVQTSELSKPARASSGLIPVASSGALASLFVAAGELPSGTLTPSSTFFRYEVPTQARAEPRDASARPKFDALVNSAVSDKLRKWDLPRTLPRGADERGASVSTDCGVGALLPVEQAGQAMVHCWRPRVGPARVLNLSQQRESVRQAINPALGFDLNKIGGHYQHRLLARAAVPALARGYTVPLSARHRYGEHGHVLAYARVLPAASAGAGEPAQVCIVAVNFNAHSSTFYVDLSPLASVLGASAASLMAGCAPSAATPTRAASHRSGLRKNASVGALMAMESMAPEQLEANPSDGAYAAQGLGGHVWTVRDAFRATPDALKARAANGSTAEWTNADGPLVALCTSDEAAYAPIVTTLPSYQSFAWVFNRVQAGELAAGDPSADGPPQQRPAWRWVFASSLLRLQQAIRLPALGTGTAVRRRDMPDEGVHDLVDAAYGLSDEGPGKRRGAANALRDEELITYARHNLIYALLRRVAVASSETSKQDDPKCAVALRDALQILADAWGVHLNHAGQLCAAPLPDGVASMDTNWGHVSIPEAVQLVRAALSIAAADVAGRDQADQVRASQSRIVQAVAAVSCSPECNEVVQALAREVLRSSDLGHIVFITSELGKWSTVGGLGVMVDELCETLAGLGAQVTVISPYYNVNRKGRAGYLHDDGIEYSGRNIVVHAGGERYDCGVHEGFVNGVHVMFLHNGIIFPRPYPPCDARAQLRALVVFAKGVLQTLCDWRLIPSVAITNDWFTALVPAYARCGHFGSVFDSTDFLHIIHNGDDAYQGRLWPMPGDGTLQWLHDLPDSLLVNPAWQDCVINPTRAAIMTSDTWATVSWSYRADLLASSTLADLLSAAPQPFAHPNGIRLIARKAKLPHVTHEQAKAQLQHTYFGPTGVDPNTCLLGFVGRITSQKGVHLILDTVERLIDSTHGQVQFIIGGMASTTDPYGAWCANKMAWLRQRYPRHFWADATAFFTDGPMLNVGCNYFLMPSMFEPSGIVQHESFIAGTPVVAFCTGGLKDTVFEWNEQARTGNGFLFRGYSADDYTAAVQRAVNLYHHPDDYAKLRENAAHSVIGLGVVAQAWMQEFQRLKRVLWMPPTIAASGSTNEEGMFEAGHRALSGAPMLHDVLASDMHVQARPRIGYVLVSGGQLGGVSPSASVAVAGSFNDWSPVHLANFTHESVSTWHGMVLLPPGKYPLKFIVNGEWKLAEGWPLQSEAGMQNNVLVIKESAEA